MAKGREEELGVRLQAEHAALMQLTQLVKQHIAGAGGGAAGPWLEGLRVAFGRLQAHIERDLAMKEKDGYLETIMRERPMLARQVEAIKIEHPQLLTMAEGLRRDLEQARPHEKLLMADVCARVQRFMAVVAQHEQRENMLVLFAFNQDLGAY